jgi:hypothetical protein
MRATSMSHYQQKRRGALAQGSVSLQWAYDSWFLHTDQIPNGEPAGANRWSDSSRPIPNETRSQTVSYVRETESCIARTGKHTPAGEFERRTFRTRPVCCPGTRISDEL